MKKIVVAMYDEEGYTRRLADYFCQHQKNLFDVRLFTSEESLRKFLIGQGTELLITGERDWELFRGINHGIHRLILLSDGQCVREDNGQAVLFKYQSAESMLQEVLAIVADDEELKVPLPKKQMKGTEFVGVFVPQPATRSQQCKCKSWEALLKKEGLEECLAKMQYVAVNRGRI